MASEIIASADITDHSSVSVYPLDNGDYRIEWSLITATIRHTTSVRLTKPALLATREAIDSIIATTHAGNGESAFSDDVRDLMQRVQYLVDNWPAELPDGGITFPDGKFWPTC